MSINTTKFCSQCGNPINPQQKFCGNCGYQLSISPSKQQRKRSTNEIFALAMLAILVVIIGIGFISFLFNFSIRKSGLPPNVARLFQEENYSILQVSKASYPENFVWGLGGWLRGGDEIWCVTYTVTLSSSWIVTSNDIAVRKGADWSRYDIYENMWDMVGCRHKYVKR